MLVVAGTGMGRERNGFRTDAWRLRPTAPAAVMMGGKVHVLSGVAGTASLLPACVGGQGGYVVVDHRLWGGRGGREEHGVSGRADDDVVGGRAQGSSAGVGSASLLGVVPVLRAPTRIRCRARSTADQVLVDECVNRDLHPFLCATVSRGGEGASSSSGPHHWTLSDT